MPFMWPQTGTNISLNDSFYIYIERCPLYLGSLKLSPFSSDDRGSCTHLSWMLTGFPPPTPVTGAAFRLNFFEPHLISGGNIASIPGWDGSSVRCSMQSAYLIACRVLSSWK